MDFICQSSFRLMTESSIRHRDFPYTSCPAVHSLPQYQCPTTHQSATFVTTEEPALTHHCPPKSTVHGVVHSLGSDTYVTTCIHHYSNIQSSFPNLKIPCAPPIRLSLPASPWQHRSFTVSIVLPFRYMMVGITQNAAFTGWLLSLSNMPLNFPHIFSWLDSYLSRTYNIILLKHNSNTNM